jgi:UDP-N-acetylmuramate: L-alanyl-gamma-D-glutamyl-meso-diaminopimelate ligase
MHIHILGICGTFMGGIAAIARQAGHTVTGCDRDVYPPMSDQLRALGIELIEGFDASQVELRPDLWVIGNVVSRGNPLMEAILEARLPFTSGPQWLSEQVLLGRRVLAVAGTHGKTTTASLLAWILEAGGQRPGFLIGGVPGNFPVSARLGEGECFVIEADEYDTAFFDKRSKFVHYRPSIAVFNNLEFDHADIFADLAAIETQFHHLVRTMATGACIVHNAQAPALDRVLARGLWSKAEPFLSNAGWSLSNVREGSLSCRFVVSFAGQAQAHCELPLAGEHNRANALAAIAAAARAGIAPQQACEALAHFKGVRRRLELRGTVRGVSVYDDFAHHPTAIHATIAGLRARLQGQGRVLAVVEPRSNTMRLGTMRAQLGPSLAQADLCFCSAAGLSWNPAEDLEMLGLRASVASDVPTLVDRIVAAARPGDHILVMSNGGFGGIHDRLLEALAKPNHPGQDDAPRNP